MVGWLADCLVCWLVGSWFGWLVYSVGWFVRSFVRYLVSDLAI